MSGDEAKMVTIDGTKYNLSELTENARAQLVSIQFVDNQLQQLSSEWAVADTARMAYTAALKREIQDEKEWGWALNVQKD